MRKCRPQRSRRPITGAQFSRRRGGFSAQSERTVGRVDPLPGTAKWSVNGPRRRNRLTGPFGGAKDRRGFLLRGRPIKRNCAGKHQEAAATTATTTKTTLVERKRHNERYIAWPMKNLSSYIKGRTNETAKSVSLFARNLFERDKALVDSARLANSIRPVKCSIKRSLALKGPSKASAPLREIGSLSNETRLLLDRAR